MSKHQIKLLRGITGNANKMRLRNAHFSPADFRRDTQINGGVYVNEIACSIYPYFSRLGRLEDCKVWEQIVEKR